MSAQSGMSADDHDDITQDPDYHDAVSALAWLLGQSPFDADAPRKITGHWHLVEVWCDSRRKRCCLGRVYRTPAGHLWAVHTRPPQATQATWYPVLLDHRDRSPRRIKSLWLSCRHGTPGTGLLDPDEVRALLGDVLAGRTRPPGSLVIPQYDGMLPSTGLNTGARAGHRTDFPE